MLGKRRRPVDRQWGNRRRRGRVPIVLWLGEVHADARLQDNSPQEVDSCGKSRFLMAFAIISGRDGVFTTSAPSFTAIASPVKSNLPTAIRGETMPARRQYWLMKSEPDSCSIDDLCGAEADYVLGRCSKLSGAELHAGDEGWRRRAVLSLQRRSGSDCGHGGRRSRGISRPHSALIRPMSITIQRHRAITRFGRWLISSWNRCLGVRWFWMNCAA